MNNNFYGQLFGAQDEDIMETVTAISKDQIYTDRQTKRNTMLLISIIAARLSFVASIWVFLFNHSLWYGMLIFALLCIVAGNMEDTFIKRRG